MELRKSESDNIKPFVLEKKPDDREVKSSLRVQLLSFVNKFEHRKKEQLRQWMTFFRQTKTIQSTRKQRS